MFAVTDYTITLCDQEGIQGPDRWAVVLAAIGHDADVHLPLEGSGFATKEQRSAHIMMTAILDTAPENSTKQELWDRFVFAGHVASIIISTEPQHKVKGDKLKYIVNAADLANIHDTDKEMLRRTGALFVEHIVSKTQEYVPTSFGAAMLNNSDELREWCTNTRKSLRTLAETKQQDIAAKIAKISPSNLKKALEMDDIKVFGRVRSEQTIEAPRQIG